MAVTTDVSVIPSTASNGPEAPVERKRCWWADDGREGPLEFRMAGDTDAFDGAFRLVHDQYVWRGYMAPHQSGWRLSLHNALPSTKVFVAKAGARLIGTLTLIQDSPIGLPMEEIYQEELKGLRDQGRHMAEVSALAIDPTLRASGVAILMRLVRMLVLYAAEFGRLDDLCIAVNPRHVEFYRKFLHFRPFGQLKHYRKVNGAPAIALRLDLGLVRALIEVVHSGHPCLDELYGFFFGPENYRGVMAQLRRDVPRSALTPQLFAHFFADHDVLSTASAKNLAFLQSFYSDLDLGELAHGPAFSPGVSLSRPALIPALSA